MRTERDAFYAARVKGFGKVVGLRPEHCSPVRYASWAEVKPVLDLLNRPKRGRWMGRYCALCAGWHSAMMDGQVVVQEAQEVVA